MTKHRRHIWVLGHSLSGKTTLHNELDEFNLEESTDPIVDFVPVWDVDDCRHPAMEPRLRKLRTAGNWTQHNDLWYPMVLGGLEAYNRYGFDDECENPTVVLDHGPWMMVDYGLYAYTDTILVLPLLSDEEINYRTEMRILDFQASGKPRVEWLSRDMIRDMAMKNRDDLQNSLSIFDTRKIPYTHIRQDMDPDTSVHINGRAKVPQTMYVIEKIVSLL